MASRPLSLAAYRALAKRATPALPDLSIQRPEGELVWIHAGQIADCHALMDLADRLILIRPGTHVFLTLPPDMGLTWPQFPNRPHIQTGYAPDEHPQSVRQFLDHWRPNAVMWIWGGLRPNLVDEVARRGVDLHLVSADAQGFDGRRDRWLPELARTLMPVFTSISARSDTAVQRLMRLGLRERDIIPNAELRPTGHLLACDETDLDEMTTALGGRPVWLAAEVLPEEIPAVLTAHRLALRSAHRLLLVLNPTEPIDLRAICESVDRQGLARGVWGDGEWPAETMQVLVADLPGELGLWYRTAAVSFLGKSLFSGNSGMDPLSPAALGTAILYGPNVRGHLPSYTRLANAGAARIVTDEGSLGTAVAQLTAPDRAAAMAHAGWQVISETAEALDATLERLQASLDADTPTGAAGGT